MRDVTVGVCLVMVFGRAAAAQEVQPPRHVRAESIEMRELVAETANRSATFRALVADLDRSDVIVYVRPRFFSSQTLDGRIGFLGARLQTRFLAIELACPRSRDTQMATLAHELQHAVEIARAPWVVGAPTLARYYQQIGTQISGGALPATFESDAARATGARVRHELFASPPRTETTEAARVR